MTEPNSDFRGPGGLGTENADPRELRSQISYLTCQCFIVPVRFHWHGCSGIAMYTLYHEILASENI